MTFLSRRPTLPAFALVLAGALACGPARAGTPPGPAPTVIVVSFDALGDRFLDRDTLPNFHRMMREGVRAPFQPEFPSKTFPNHYSMATGLPPGRHGIVTNSFFDPARHEKFLKTSAGDGSWFGGEPVWVTAERAGVRAAAYFWPGTEAEIMGRRPSYWHRFDPAVPDSVKIGEIMHWLRLPGDSQPRLIVMYSAVVDVPGHLFGPDSPQAYAGVREADRVVGVLRDSLARLQRGDIDLIVVSDHGLAAVPSEHRVAVDRLLPRRGVIVDDEHATLSIWQDPAGPRVDLDSLATALRRAIPHVRVYRRGAFPPAWQTEQNPRFGDLFLLADPGYEFVSDHGFPTRGEHGYDPRTPAMMGIFLAVGPDFRPGVRLAPRENRTLHDLLIRLLGLQNPLDSAALPDFGLAVPRTP